MKTPKMLSTKEKQIFRVIDLEWEEGVYLVEVAYSENNIIHKAIMEVGFSLYHPASWIHSCSYEDPIHPSKAVYLKKIKKLLDKKEIKQWK